MLPSPQLVVLAVKLPVHSGPEVEIDPGGSGRGEALGQQDPDHVLDGVRRPGRAQAALPPVAPGVANAASSLPIVDKPKPQPRSLGRRGRSRTTPSARTSGDW